MKQDPGKKNQDQEQVFIRTQERTQDRVFCRTIKTVPHHPRRDDGDDKVYHDGGLDDDDGGGGQRDSVAFCFDEYVLEDRHRRAVTDDVGDAGETVEKVISVNLELHDDGRIEDRQGVRQPLIAHIPGLSVSSYSSFINTSSSSRCRNPVYSSASHW